LLIKNITLTASKTLLNSNLSSFFTDVRHKTDAVFLWTIYFKNIVDSNKYIDTIGFVFQKKAMDLLLHRRRLGKTTAPRRDLPFTIA